MATTKRFRFSLYWNGCFMVINLAALFENLMDSDPFMVAWTGAAVLGFAWLIKNESVKEVKKALEVSHEAA